MKNTTLHIALSVFGLIGLATACSKPGSTQHAVVNSSLSFPEKGNFRLSLTDAPHPTLTSVFVTIDHVEILLENGGKQGRLILGQDMGTIDLLKLRDGVHLPIRDLNLKENVVVKQFRLILKDEGHWFVRKDQSTCYMKTPSQQKTGLKLLIPGGGVSIEAGSMYSLTVDFDVDHSIVDNGDNCLLKPVLKVKSLVKAPQDSEDSDDSPDSGGSGSETGDGTSTGSGGDSGSQDMTGGDTSSSDGTTAPADGTTTTDGSGGSSADGSTSTGSAGDGAPVIVDGDPSYFQ